MDNLTLDDKSLMAIADIIDIYCQKQSEILEKYYTQILSLNGQWKDDETFGQLVEEIQKLKSGALASLQEMCATYPKYFRQKALSINERPSFDGTNNITDNTAGAENAHKGERCSAGNVPNSFAETKEVWHSAGGYVKVYDTPKETGEKLNCNQGVPVNQGGEGVENFLGTCGLVSCENVLRMAGVDVTEKEIVKYAINNGYCTVCDKNYKNGGTFAKDRQAVLYHYGIPSSIKYTTNLEKIANYVEDGKGVIVSVEAHMLWYKSHCSIPSRHAITVTSVQRDIKTNEITGFYICDSGSRNSDSSRYIPSDLMSACLEATGGELNITNTVIR